MRMSWRNEKSGLKAKVWTLSWGFWLIGFAPHAQQAGPVESIMVKVARNQDRALELRSSFVYQQELLIRFKRSDGRLCREEIHEFTVTPSAKGIQKKLTGFRGKYLKDREYITYKDPGYRYKDLDLDGDLITDFADDFANDGGTRDGLAADLFPVTSQEQKKYVFALRGTDRLRDREVFRITFRPCSRVVNLLNKEESEPEEGIWAGEILVDTADYQPVEVTTHLAKGIPFWVKTLLGANIAHLGFRVEYARFSHNLWFPVRYGGEFKLKAVFFYKRSMAIALENRGFQRVNVTTVLTYGEPLDSVRGASDTDANGTQDKSGISCPSPNK
jgi:hypothetical protein